MEDNEGKNLRNKDLKIDSYNNGKSQDDIEDQIAKSIEKLVEEETNVARAFVNGNQEDYSSLYNGKNASTQESVWQDPDLLNGKTQVIPNIPHDQQSAMGDTQVLTNMPQSGMRNAIHNDETAELNLDMFQSQNMNDNHFQNSTNYGAQNDAENNADNYAVNADEMDDASYHDTCNDIEDDSDHDSQNSSKNDSQNGSKNAGQRTSQNQSNADSNHHLQNQAKNHNVEKSDGNKDKKKKKKKMTRKKKAVIVCVIIAAILLIAGIITAVVVINKNRQSFTYNYNQGMEQYNEQNYEEALTYFKKAYNTVDGKKSTDLMYTMYECYMKLDDTENAESMLKALLAYDKYNEKGLKALAQLYVDEKNGTSLTELIEKYSGTKGEQYLQEFELTEPSASEEAGEYSQPLSVTLLADDDVTIYYTTNGTDPTTKSSVYTSAIEVESGTTVIKAIAVDSIGLTSSISEFKYVIEYKKPSAPEITPASGTYDSGQTFTIDNLSDGDTAYYTIDGTDPTTSSTVYTGEVTIPEGNIVVAAIIVNQYDMESSITRRNYNITVTQTYTYEEAQDILEKRMITNGDLKSSGISSSGNSISMVYQNKITVDDVEMYYIRIDETKNGSIVTKGYYGVGIKNGECYTITSSSGSYTAKSY